MDQVRPLPLLPTTLVGSFPQPDWLVDKSILRGELPPRVRMAKVWCLPEAVLAAAQRDAARLAVLDQEIAGIDIVTDGEVGRESYFNLFATGLGGIDLDRPGTTKSRLGRDVPVPRVTGPIVWQQSPLAAAAAHLRSLTARPIRVTVPGPFTLTSLAQDDYYKDAGQLAMAYAVAVNQELAALKEVGVDVVQLDEPYLQSKPDAARAYGLDAVNRALSGIDGTTALHLCFGYAYVVKDKPAGYSLLGELERTSVKQVSIEAAQPKLDVGILADLPTKDVILGVLDLGMAEIETADVVAARVRRALKHIEPRRLVLAPDCGMKYLDHAVAMGKLRAMTTAAAIVRAEFA
jgi:5-methyltetrahydropteroyltriglutamate--homocysteine methyltransferase